MMLGSILWQSLNRIPLALGLLALTVLAVLWMYRRQSGLLGKPWRWVLPSLRILALGALLLSILRPILIRAKTTSEQGTLLVIVDDSMSMSVTDSSRTAAARLALADALGDLPNRPKSQQAADITQKLDQASLLLAEMERLASEVDYARLSGRGVKEAQSRLEDKQAQFDALQKEFAGLAEAGPAKNAVIERMAQLAEVDRSKRLDGFAREWRSRAGRLRSAVAQLQGELDDKFYRSDPAARAAADALASQSRYDLVEKALLEPGKGLIDHLPAEMPLAGMALRGPAVLFPLRRGDKPIVRLPARPDAIQSDLAGALAAARASLGKSLRGIVLFSDGRQVGTSAESVPEVNVPILAVSVVARGAPVDLSLTQPTIPVSAFVDETIAVCAHVRLSGMKKVAIDLRCTVGDEEQKRSISVNDERDIPVEFSFKLKQNGVLPIRLEVAPLPGEASLENNRIERWIKVISDKIHIAAFSGTATWDFQYLRNALSRTAWAKLDHGVLDSPSAQLPLSPDEIMNLGVLILHDVPIGALSAAQWNAVSKLVLDRGGSVLLLAGESHLPGEYLHDAQAQWLLPFADGAAPVWRTWPGEAPGYHILPTPAGSKYDALKMADDPEQSRRRWAELSPVYRILQASEWKPSAVGLLAEADSKSPVLTETRLGRGRVFFVGFDETWRWRYEVGERDQDRFWLQLIRYASESPYQASEGKYSLDVDRASVRPDESIHVRARVREEPGATTQPATLEVVLLQQGSPRRVERLVAQPFSPDRFEGTLSGLPAGDLELQLRTSDGPVPGLIVPVHVIESTEAEMADLSGDEKYLQRLAEGSGGEMIRLDQIASLPQRIQDVQREQSRFLERPLWDSPWLFGFVLACLSAEWALRKRLGLV